MELSYEPLDLAVIIRSLNLEYHDQEKLLNDLYTYDRWYLLPNHRGDKETFYAAVMEEVEKIGYEVTIDPDYPKINEEFAALDLEVNRNEVATDDQDIALFFKSMRIRMLYVGEIEEFKSRELSLQELVQHYGYTKVNEKFREFVYDCLMFFRIQAYVNEFPADIMEVDPNEMISFRMG